MIWVQLYAVAIAALTFFIDRKLRSKAAYALTPFGFAGCGFILAFLLPVVLLQLYRTRGEPSKFHDPGFVMQMEMHGLVRPL